MNWFQRTEENHGDVSSATDVTIPIFVVFLPSRPTVYNRLDWTNLIIDISLPLIRSWRPADLFLRLFRREPFPVIKNPQTPGGQPSLGAFRCLRKKMDGTAAARVNGTSVRLGRTIPDGVLPSYLSEKLWQFDGQAVLHLSDELRGLKNVTLAGVEAQSPPGSLIWLPAVTFPVMHLFPAEIFVTT